MPTFVVDRALLPSGWARDVLLDVDSTGYLAAVKPNSASSDAQRLHGTALPGMINLHSHAFQRAMAGLSERGGTSPDSFWSWRERMYAFLAAITPDDVDRITAHLYTEMLEAGYTSVVEFHYLHQSSDGRPHEPLDLMSQVIIAAARRAGIGLTHLPALYRTGDFDGVVAGPGQLRFTLTVRQLLDVVDRSRAAADDDPAVRVGLGLHSLRAVPPEALAEALSQFRKGDPWAPVHIHVAEQPQEVEACRRWSGARPVEWLLDNTTVDDKWCFIHATHVDEGEVRRFADTGAVAGLCPTTEANLGDGIFPLRDFLDHAGRLGIGSDSHVSIDPFEELRMLEYGQRLSRHERNVVTRGEDASSGRRLWELACEGGALAAGRPVGRLERGRRADWIVPDPGHPTLAGREEDLLLDTLVFAGGPRPPLDVYVAGHRVVEAGRHAARDRIVDDYRLTAERLLR